MPPDKLSGRVTSGTASARHGIGRLRRAHRRIGLCVIFGIAAAASAQHAQPPGRTDNDGPEQRDQDRLRGAKLVGPDDDLAIELPNGDRIPLGREQGCRPPARSSGVVKVDCTLLDGPADYFDESTRTLIVSCSPWLPDSRHCPPAQWPIELPGCAAAALPSIRGTWRLYALPTANGFSPIDGGWTVALAEDTVTFDFGPGARIERSYSVVERDGQRYSLEMRDARSASTLADFELAPCGLVIESEGVCDTFCQNIAAERGTPTEAQIREFAKRTANGRDDESLRRTVATIRESLDRGPQPIFPKRALFVAEVVRRPP